MVNVTMPCTPKSFNAVWVFATNGVQEMAWDVSAWARSAPWELLSITLAGGLVEMAVLFKVTLLTLSQVSGEPANGMELPLRSWFWSAVLHAEAIPASEPLHAQSTYRGLPPIVPWNAAKLAPL